MPFPYQRIGRFLSSEYQTNSFEVSYSEQGLCPFADPRDFSSSSMATMNDELHFYPHCQLASYFKYFHQSRKHYQIIIKQCDLMDLILYLKRNHSAEIESLIFPKQGTLNSKGNNTLVSILLLVVGKSNTKFQFRKILDNSDSDCFSILNS